LSNHINSSLFPCIHTHRFVTFAKIMLQRVHEVTFFKPT
jgi:hypothetical protein